jgi:hypothetical protein
VKPAAFDFWLLIAVLAAAAYAQIVSQTADENMSL